MIYDIQKFSIHDGPGVRTIIFFKGCPLRCEWCENPESQSFFHELMYDGEICIGCMDCVGINQKAIHFFEGKITIDPDQIVDYSPYEKICPTRALTVVGMNLSTDQIIEEIIKDLPFYKNGGGVTISGGEPFAQQKLLFDLCKKLRENDISTAVETSLHCPWHAIEQSIDLVDLFLVGIKHHDETMLMERTGGNLEQILGNLKNLNNASSNIWIRIPVIPGFNDNFQDLLKIIRMIEPFDRISELHFLPYHTLGIGKYRMLSKPYLASPKSFTCDFFPELALIAKNLGLQTHIAGGY